MRFAIVYSIKDQAGINITNQLRKIGFMPQFPIIELKKETIYSENLNKKNYPELRNIDFIIFASKHKSEKKEKSLSVHAPGNWRSADFGGKPGKICKTSAFVLKYLFQKLNENTEQAGLKDFKITMEVTHHGPLIEIPCCFIELGSSEDEWGDEDAAKIIANTIMTLQNYKPNEKWIPAIGVGGPHYCPNFNKIQLNSDYAISHVIPEYVLPLSETMLKEAEQKTSEQIKTILLDWKGVGNSEKRQEIVNLIEKIGLQYKRTGGIEK